MSARIEPSAPWPAQHPCENTITGRGFDRPTSRHQQQNSRGYWALFISLVVGGWVFATYLLKPLLALAIEVARAIGVTAS